MQVTNLHFIGAYALYTLYILPDSENYHKHYTCNNPTGQTHFTPPLKKIIPRLNSVCQINQ